jgi:hypothetical protein
MPLIVAAILAALCPLRLGSWPALPGLSLPVNASLPAAIGLAAWWAVWAVKEHDAVWGACGVALAAALYALADVAYQLRPHGGGFAAPLTWVVLGSLLQAGSHIMEPLPPRVSRSAGWVPVREYVFGPPQSRYGPMQVLRRCGHLAWQTLFGTVDELVASPRLLPVLLLQWLWLTGHRPQQSAAYRALADRAIATGNPALDFIGTGGATPLRVPVAEYAIAAPLAVEFRP